MKRLTLISILFLLFESILFSQTIPIDSLYLGQTPPGNTPKIFKLYVDFGFFAAERIAISNDGKDIYFSQIKGYYPIRGTSIKKHSYSGNKWTGPFNVFDGYIAPALSVSGNIMYFQNDSVETFFSVKNVSSWGTPQRILANLNLAHYLQVTNNGSYYVSSISNPSVGGNDWCKLFFNVTDTTAISLGRPLNTSGNNFDFLFQKMKPI